MKTRSLVVLAAFSMTVACAPVDEPTPGFGNAVRQNIAAQVVNPDPRSDDLPPPELDGERTRTSVDRYRADKVKAPVPLGTSSVRGNQK